MSRFPAQLILAAVFSIFGDGFIVVILLSVAAGLVVHTLLEKMLP